MCTRNEVLDRLSSFLDMVFPDGEPNSPNWLQDPYCSQLFGIYVDSTRCGMTDHDLTEHVRGIWNITLQTRMTPHRQKQIDQLCYMLSAWETYERCQANRR